MDMIDIIAIAVGLLYIGMFIRNEQVSAKVNAKIDDLHR